MQEMWYWNSDTAVDIEYVALNTFAHLISSVWQFKYDTTAWEMSASRARSVLHQSVLKMSVDFEVDLQEEIAFETCYYRHHC